MMGAGKAFFCLAANLLELSDLQGVIDGMCGGELALSSVKERGAYAAEAFKRIADSRNIVLKLAKKK